MISARWTSVSEADHQAGRRGQEAHLSCLVCRCPVPVCPRWPDSARPLSRKSLEMARCRGRWSDFWQTPDPPPACDTPMAWNYPAMIGPLPRCLRRGPQGKKKKEETDTFTHTLTQRERPRGLAEGGGGARLSVCLSMHPSHPPPLFIPPPPPTPLSPTSLPSPTLLSVYLTYVPTSYYSTYQLAPCQMPLVYAARPSPNGQNQPILK